MKNSPKSLSRVLLSKKALIQNHKALQDFHPEAKVCPVLKSNAYGHGIKELANVFDNLGCEFLVVNNLQEADILSNQKVKTPVLIIGYTAPESFQRSSFPYHTSIFDLEVANTLHRYHPGTNVHIFVDTGMRREGVLPQDLPDFVQRLKKLDLKIVGICSHFSDADNSNSLDFTHKQIKVFKNSIKTLKDNGIDPKWRHISASGGAFKIQDPEFNMIRAGKAHYGINPLALGDKFYNKIKLTPVLELHTTLAHVKRVPKGSEIGYSRTFSAKEDMTLGLLPAGYFEGIDRRLSNKGYVKIREQFFPIVGRVSMNMTTIDISDIKGPMTGERVIIYSSDPDDKNSIANSAFIAGTISYDLLVHIPESLERLVTE